MQPLRFVIVDFFGVDLSQVMRAVEREMGLPDGKKKENSCKLKIFDVS